MRIICLSFFIFFAAIESSKAHVSQQGFVLLLPTDIYIFSGALAVALTIVLLAFLPARIVKIIFTNIELGNIPAKPWLEVIFGTVSFIILVFVILMGIYGSRDPLTNILPLTIWTLFWMMLVTMAGIFGNFWRWINPWIAPYRLLTNFIFKNDTHRFYNLPQIIGVWPAIIQFACFAGFMLADIAPDDPFRLAIITGSYWLLNLVFLILFGPQWLERGECFSVLFRSFSYISIVKYKAPKLTAGLPGWQLIQAKKYEFSFGLFALLILGVGSFDGLNETFWWLALIGINPLEFPGRSAIISETLLGLSIACLLLIAIFASAIKIGLWLVERYDGIQTSSSFQLAFSKFALSALPIAFGYHIAHYLPSFLVNGQYALAAISDPLDRGNDFLGLGTFYVTTGFFNTHTSAHAIWFTQATCVVVGHIASILTAHRIALDLYDTEQAALRSQIPISIFMVIYTGFGLWLLASPRGI